MIAQRGAFEGAWKIESNPSKQRALMGAGVAVGAVLAFGFRGAALAGETNALAGAGLGLLVLALSIVCLVRGDRRSICVDPAARRIFIEDVSRFGRRRQSIHFRQIVEVHLRAAGDQEGGSISYDVELELEGGKSVSLFGRAYFDGRYDRSAMEAHRIRLAASLHR